MRIGKELERFKPFLNDYEDKYAWEKSNDS